MTHIQGNGAGLKLSRRLSALSDWVPDNARLADIGTDHALLPVFLASNGKVRFAVAGDVHRGPVEAAKRQVAEAGLQEVISVRLGDGLAVITPGEVDTVVIAGMGGSLMVRILDQGRDRLRGVRTLVLSPHVAEGALRSWLTANGYLLDREMLLEEDGVIYTLIRAVLIEDRDEWSELHRRLYDPSLAAPCLPRIPLPLMYEMGPLLMRNPSPEFEKKWLQEIAKKERVVLQLNYSDAPEAAVKAQEWEQDIREIREVLSCLPEEKRSSN